jgi:predicted transcriptional regulator
MTVGAVCNHNVVTIHRDLDVVEAARRMRENHVGALIVVDGRGGAEAPVGVVTDRDIVVEIVAKDVSPHAVKVADIMSAGVLKVHEDNGVMHALREMHRAGVRRVVVVGENERLRGVLALDDVIDHLAEQMGHLASAIRTEQRVESEVRP